MRLRESDMPRQGEWERYFRPRDTLLMLGLREGMVFADLGCGYGTFAIPGAEIVGARGWVYAGDIDKRMVERVRRRAKETSLTNVTALLGDITSRRGLRLPDESVDFALLANVVHGAKDKAGLLRSVARILRLGAVVAILNWRVDRTPRGPPTRMRPTPEQTMAYVVRAGYTNPVVLEVPPYHYAVVAWLSRS